jgi:hypothetical protein
LRNVEPIFAPKPELELELEPVEDVAAGVALAFALFVVDWTLLRSDARLIGDVDIFPP